MSRRIWAILLFSYVLILNCVNLPHVVNAIEGTDSPTYLGWYDKFRSLQIPHLGHRTPTYPLIIAAVESFGDWRDVVWVQAFVGALAAVALFYLVQRIVRHAWIAVLVSAAIVSDYSIISWHGSIVTESFSLSFLIFWLLFHLGAIGAVEIPVSKERALWIGLAFDLLLMFLRPTFYVLPLCWYTMIGFFSIWPGGVSINRRSAIRNALITITAGLVFCFMNYLQSARFEITDISRMGRLGNLMYLGFVNEEACTGRSCSPVTLKAIEIYSRNNYANDPWLFRTRLQKTLFDRPWNEVLDTLILDLGGGKSLQLIGRALPRWKSLFYDRWIYLEEGMLYSRSAGYRKLTQKYADFTTDWTYFSLYWNLSVVLGLLIAFRKIDWIRAALLFVVAYVSLVSMIGAYNEWSRLLTPIRIPVYFLIFYVAVDLVKAAVFICSKAARLTVTLLLIVFLPTMVWGVEIHVSLRGDDRKGFGTSDSPYASIEKALTQAQPGDSVLIHGGTYARSKVRIKAEGKPQAPIYIKAVPGEEVILDGKGSAEPVKIESENKRDVPSVFDIRYSKHLVIDGLKIAHSPGYGISLWESEHITVKNCEIHHTWSRGLGGSGAHLIFEENKIHDVVLQNQNEKALKDQVSGGENHWSSAAATWYREDGSLSKDVVWKGNQIERSWGEGLNALHVDGALLTGNTVSNAFSVLIYVDHSRNVRVEGNHLFNTLPRYLRSDTKDLPVGVLLASEKYKGTAPVMLENVLIFNNVISNVSFGIAFWRDANNSDETNKYRGVTIAHNLIVPLGPYAIRMLKINESITDRSKNRILNNVIYDGRLLDEDSERLVSASIHIHNPNLWILKNNVFPNGLSGVVNQELLKSSKNYQGDPKLKDPRALSPLGIEGYKPLSQSPLLGAGVPMPEIKVDFSGNPRSMKNPAIGPFEKAIK